MNERFSHQETVTNSEVFKLSGRVLYLTEDSDLIRRQLEGEDLDLKNENFLIEVSTDEIIPNRVCLKYTGHESNLLGNNVLTGLRGGIVKPGEIVNGGIEAIVAGPSFGRGSSRYHAPIALQEAGIKVIIAEPERIFAENGINAGIHIIPPRSKAAFELLENRQTDIETLHEYLSPVAKEIMITGSLIRYLRNLEEGKKQYPVPDIQSRSMTMVEKIIAKNTHTNNYSVGISFIKPGDEVIVKPNSNYGYELQTTVARKALQEEFRENEKIRSPEKAYLFNDHTALIQERPEIQTQQKEQKIFADKHGIKNFENDENGAPAICHTKMLEDYANPGELILGNDSHTCTLGAVNSLAVGKGAADLAGAWAFDKMYLKVPETIRVNIIGELKNGATMKDAILQFGARKDMKEERLASGRVLEFGGDTLNNIPFDEQVKLANMAVELQAFTGILEPNEQMFLYLNEIRGMSFQEFTRQLIFSDSSATYYDEKTLDLSKVEPMVATPGDTQNGVPLSEIKKQKKRIDIAYFGSCTSGTLEDFRMAAKVADGKKIAEGVTMYFQANSIETLNVAKKRGYVDVLIKAGAILLPIGCGACMNAGPGSSEEGQVTLSNTNRNFHGRMGKGETYLSSSPVVMASAIKGVICGPDDLET